MLTHSSAQQEKPWLSAFQDHSNSTAGRKGILMAAIPSSHNLTPNTSAKFQLNNS
jgi:hypothetical protein